MAPSQHRAPLDEPPEHGADHLLYRILDKGVRSTWPRSSTSTRRSTPRRTRSSNGRRRDASRRSSRSSDRPCACTGSSAPSARSSTAWRATTIAQIDAKDRVYFRDVYDHLVRLHDITESLRDLISGALDTYLSAISNRTNEIMKMLTLVTVMFMPMKFLVGLLRHELLRRRRWSSGPGCPRTSLFAGVCLVTFVDPRGDVALGACGGGSEGADRSPAMVPP